MLLRQQPDVLLDCIISHTTGDDAVVLLPRGGKAIVKNEDFETGQFVHLVVHGGLAVRAIDKVLYDKIIHGGSDREIEEWMQIAEKKGVLCNEPYDPGTSDDGGLFHPVCLYGGSWIW